MNEQEGLELDPEVLLAALANSLPFLSKEDRTELFRDESVLNYFIVHVVLHETWSVYGYLEEAFTSQEKCLLALESAFVFLFQQKRTKEIPLASWKQVLSLFPPDDAWFILTIMLQEADLGICIRLLTEFDIATLHSSSFAKDISLDFILAIYTAPHRTAMISLYPVPLSVEQQRFVHLKALTMVELECILSCYELSEKTLSTTLLLLAWLRPTQTESAYTLLYKHYKALFATHEVPFLKSLLTLRSFKGKERSQCVRQMFKDVDNFDPESQHAVFALAMLADKNDLTQLVCVHLINEHVVTPLLNERQCVICQEVPDQRVHMQCNSIKDSDHLFCIHCIQKGKLHHCCICGEKHPLEFMEYFFV